MRLLLCSAAALLLLAALALGAHGSEDTSGALLETSASLSAPLDDPNRAKNLDNPETIKQNVNGLDDPKSTARDAADAASNDDVDSQEGTTPPLDGVVNKNAKWTPPPVVFNQADNSSGTTHVITADNENVVKDYPVPDNGLDAETVERKVKKQQARDLKKAKEESRKNAALARSEADFKKKELEEMDARRKKFQTSFQTEVKNKKEQRKEHWQKTKAKTKDSDEENTKAAEGAVDAIRREEETYKKNLHEKEKNIKDQARQKTDAAEQEEKQREQAHNNELMKEKQEFEAQADKEAQEVQNELDTKQKQAQEELAKKNKEAEDNQRQAEEEARKKEEAQLKEQKEREQNEEKQKQEQDENAKKAQQEAAQKQQERAQKQASEEAEKANWNVKGLCAFAAQGQGGCPNGWTDSGWAGSITNNPNDGNLNPFNHGGQFNPWWWWSHPRLCCASQDFPDLGGRIYMLGDDSCMDRKGLFGIIKTAGDYDQSPFAGGGDFNGGWRWTHPFMCKINGDKMTLLQHRQQNRRLCMLSTENQCRGKFSSDRGWVGIIVPKDNQPPMNLGGMFNPWWRWAHPRLCCSF